MVRYLSLMSFTDQGIRDVDQSSTRACKFRAAVEEAGGKVLSLYWAVGEFDGAFVIEAPDETTATRLLLSLGKLGNVRTRSLRVYDEAEFQQVLGGA
ncbi:MAG: GYD domain-containing protein [Planctomycetaceae bacterium]|nr:GYD domain-containing protein [Planctomycetaceae bacterium]